MPPKPIRKLEPRGNVSGEEHSDDVPERIGFLKRKNQKEVELPFHHHWRVGVHRHKDEIYVKLPGGRVERLLGEKQELRLTVVEARNLPQMDMGANASAEDREKGIGVTCDAFVKIQLGEEKRKTNVVRDTLDPHFGENFVFVLTDFTDERAEIARQLSNRKTVRIEVHDYDDGGDTDFVGMCELDMTELSARDEKGRFQYIDTWIDLCNEDGSKAKIRLDGTPARGSIRIRGAIRGGRQVDMLNRVQGRTWLEAGKLVEAIQMTQQLFQEGDREIIECMIDLIHRRNFDIPHLSKEHVNMLDEVGVPLGTTLNRPGRKKLDQTDEPLGLRLRYMIDKGVPLESLTIHDPRDAYFNPMKTHWIARMEAIGNLGKMSSRGDQRAVTAIMGTASDSHAGVRAKSVHVLSLLAKLGDLQVVSLLVDRIDDDDPFVRKELVGALRVLSRKNDEKTVLDVCAFMDSPRDEVRTTATQCLQAVVRPGYLTAIVETCARLESPSQAVKMNALASIPVIANKGDRVAIVEVVNRLQHPLPQIRSIALQALNFVANKGDRFALAAVGNLMEHPDYEVRRAAAQGIQLLSFPGDLAAIQVTVMRLKIDTDAICVREGAKYVAAPTTGNPPGWRDPALPQFGAKSLRGDPIEFDSILTPRLPYLMPIGRQAAVAYHAPVLPADSGVKTIAQMWWRDKYQHDTIRHRYEWAGPETALALGMSNVSRPNTSSKSRPGATSILRVKTGGSAEWISPHTMGSLAPSLNSTAVQAVRLKSSESGAHFEKFGEDHEIVDFQVSGRRGGVVSGTGRRDTKLRAVVLEDRVQTALSLQTSGTSRTGTGMKTREQRLNEKMKIECKIVLDVMEKGLIRDLLFENKDLEEEDEDIAAFGYRYPAYNDFYESLMWVLKENAELYKWWSFRLIFPSPDDKSSTDEDRNFTKIKTLVQFNPVNAQNLRKAWGLTRQLWRRYVTASSGKDPAPEIIAKKVGTLHIGIKKAQYLPRIDRFGGCDSFVELTLPRREMKTTKVVNKTLDPEWLTTFDFEINDLDFSKRSTTEEDESCCQTQELHIEGIQDDGEFEPPPGVIGLYYDQKLTMPVTHTEIQGQDELTFKDVIAHLAKKNRGDINILHSEQTAPRCRNIFFRVYTSDMLETISMAGRLSEVNLQQGFLQSDLLDEFRLDQVESEHLTTAQTLSKVSAPVQACIKHHQLGKSPISIGTVQLPMIPLLNSLASGEKSDLHGWFEVITENKQGVLVRQTDANDRPTELFLDITYEQAPLQLFNDDLPDGSQRAREGLGTAIRTLALDTLCRITGPAVQQAIKEIILCATIPSPEVYATVSRALRRVSVPSHTQEVKDVSWIPGSYVAVSASMDGTIKVWDTEYGTLLQTIRSHRGGVMSLATHERFKDVIVTSNADCSFSLWDINSGKEIDNQPFHGRQIGSICISLQGNALISADEISDASFQRDKGELRMWGVSQPPTLQEILETERLRDEYKKCAHALAACNPAAKIEPSQQRKLIYPLIERMVMIGAPADAAVAKVPGGLDETAIKEGSTALEDLYRKLADGIEYDYPPWIRSLALRVRRERKKSNIFQLTKMGVRDPLNKLQNLPTDVLRCVRYHPTDATCFATAGDDGMVRIWKIRETAVKMTVERASIHSHISFRAHPAPINSLVFHPTFEKCIVTASRTVKLWNFISKETIITLPSYSHHATSVDMWAAPKSVSATLVVGNSDGVIITWGLELTPIGTLITAHAEERHRVARHCGAVTSLRVHTKGEECISSSTDGTVLVFHTITGDVTRHFNGDPDPLSSDPSVSAISLAGYLHHNSTHVRKMAAHCLEHTAEVGDHEALAAIALKLNHEDPSIRDLVLVPIERITRRGDPQCIAAIAAMLMVQNLEVRKSVVAALIFAVDNDTTEVQRLTEFADAIIDTLNNDARMPVTAACEFVLDNLEFLEEESLADFLRCWDRIKHAGVQLIMLSAAVRLGDLHKRKDLSGIYDMLRHPNEHVGRLSGLVLAQLCVNNPEEYFWEVVAHTVADAHSSNVNIASAARHGLHKVLAAHVWNVVDRAIDLHASQRKKQEQEALARKNRRRRTRDPVGGRASRTGASSRSISTAQSQGSSRALSSAEHSRPASRATIL